MYSSMAIGVCIAALMRYELDFFIHRDICEPHSRACGLALVRHWRR